MFFANNIWVKGKYHVREEMTEDALDKGRNDEEKIKDNVSR